MSRPLTSEAVAAIRRMPAREQALLPAGTQFQRPVKITLGAVIRPDDVRHLQVARATRAHSNRASFNVLTIDQGQTPDHPLVRFRARARGAVPAPSMMDAVLKSLWRHLRMSPDRIFLGFELSKTITDLAQPRKRHATAQAEAQRVMRLAGTDDKEASAKARERLNELSQQWCRSESVEVRDELLPRWQHVRDLESLGAHGKAAGVQLRAAERAEDEAHTAIEDYQGSGRCMSGALPDPSLAERATIGILRPRKERFRTVRAALVLQEPLAAATTLCEKHYFEQVRAGANSSSATHLEAIAQPEQAVQAHQLGHLAREQQSAENPRCHKREQREREIREQDERAEWLRCERWKRCDPPQWQRRGAHA